MRFSGGLQRTGPLQTGLAQLEWLSYRSGGRGVLPNISWTVAVPAGLSDGALEAAVRALLLRHESLRTAFDADGDGLPRQHVHRGVDATVVRLADEEARRAFTEAPFDIAAEPPVRFGRTPDGDLLLVLAHVAADGLGSWILVTDLTELMAAQLDGREPGLAAEAPQPVDLALRERGAGRRRVEAALRHWDAALRDLPVTALPVGRGRAGADVVGADLESPAATLALASLHRSLGASAASLFTAAAYLALAVQYRRDRLALNLTWASRELPATRDMVATLFRDMPLLVDLGGRPSLREVLRRLQKALLVGGRQMGFDVLEFHESAGRIAAERGCFVGGPEVVSCVFDGVDWTVAEAGGDPAELLGRSRLSPIRKNELEDACNLYISAFPVEGRLYLHSRTDSSVPGVGDGTGLVRLIEAILVRAAADGDLAFGDAEALAADPWRPGPRWTEADGVWVDPDVLADRLLEHPAVRRAEVGPEDGRLTARVDADLEPWELRDFLLATDHGRGAVVCPQHFAVRRVDGTVRSGPGTDLPDLAPEGAAGRALRDAVAEANGLAAPTMAGAYLTVGGRLVRTPRVLSLLAERGFTGLAVDDFRRPTSLAALATRLTEKEGTDV